MRVVSRILPAILAGPLLVLLGACAAPRSLTEPPVSIDIVPAAVTMMDTPPAVKPVPMVIGGSILEEPLEILTVPMAADPDGIYRARALNMMAVIWAQRHEADRVEEALAACTALVPEDPYYLAKYGFLLLRREGTRSRGLDYLERAAAGGSRDLNVYFELGRTFRMNGDWERAERYLHRFMELAPGMEELKAQSLASAQGRYEYHRSSMVLESLAEIYRRQETPDRYELVLRELAAAGGVEANGHRIELAEHYLRQHDFQLSLQALNGLENLLDSSENEFVHLLSLYTRLTRVPGFLPEPIRQGVYLKNITHLDTWTSIKGVNGAVLWEGARYAVANGDTGQAVRYAEQLLKHSPDRSYLNACIELFAGAGAFAPALEVIDLIEKEWHGILPDDLLIWKGTLLTGAGRAPEGAAVFGKISGRPDLAFNAGSACLQAGLWPEAARWFRQARDQEPAGVLPGLALSEALYKGGDSAGAFKVLEELMTLASPPHADVMNALGYLLALEGRDLERALDLVGQALNGDPENAAYLDSLGWIYFRMGRLDQARDCLTRAAAGSRNGEILSHLGELYLAAGDREQARRFFIDAFLLREDPALRKRIEAMNE